MHTKLFLLLFFSYLQNVFSNSCSGTIYCPICNPTATTCPQCSNNPYCNVDTSYGYNYCKTNVQCTGFSSKYDCDRAGCTWSGYVAPEEYCYGTASQLSSQLIRRPWVEG